MTAESNRTVPSRWGTPVILMFCLGLGCSGSGGPAGNAGVDGGGGPPVPAGICLAPQPGTLPLNAACGCARDCADGANCYDELAVGLPGGACSKLCDPAAPVSCGEGARCNDVLPGLGMGICESTCRSTADCPARRYCVLDPPDRLQGSCAGYCFEAADCSLGKCDPYSHLCVPATSTMMKKGLLAACVSRDECQSGTCQLGRCTTNCSRSRGDSSCPENGICVPEEGQPDLGFCYPRCLPDNQCGDRDFRCVSHPDSSDRFCAPTPNAECSNSTVGGPPPATDGWPCTCDAQCLAGAHCKPESETGTPHGMCVRACDIRLQDCRPGAICRPFGGGSNNGICRPSCRSDEECPPSRLCRKSTGVCLEQCQSDDECLGGHCNLYSGFCEQTPLIGAGMGAICRQDGDCKSQICFQAGPPTPGFCSGACDARKQLCPDGATCAAVSGDSLGYCVRTCSSTAECAPLGLACVGSAGGRRYCWAP